MASAMNNTLVAEKTRDGVDTRYQGPTGSPAAVKQELGTTPAQEVDWEEDYEEEYEDEPYYYDDPNYETYSDDGDYYEDDKDAVYVDPFHKAFNQFKCVDCATERVGERGQVCMGCKLDVSLLREERAED